MTMTKLSLNEIKSRALEFIKEHENDEYEMGDTQKFLIDFFAVFGIDKRYINFEKRVRVNEQSGRIDGFYPAKILVEQKSKGKDLDSAYQQARAYLQGLEPNELPTHILVCDFENFHLYDLEQGSDRYSFKLKDFPKKIELFGFLTGRKKVELVEEDPVNIKASKLMGNLHDTLKDDGYDGHDLEVFLVRVLFCLFAEDTGIYGLKRFENFIRQRTSEDGSDLGAKLAELFEVLNTPEDQRLKNLDEELNRFPYVNGKLFQERIRTSAFDKRMREQLLTCAGFDWSQISPAIFGSLFQYVMDPKKRRNMGAHYTDEKNIQKVIKPLFLDEIKTELASALALKTASARKERLEKLHDKIARLKFFDPACGCGNFLVITYRELRQIELEILKALHEDKLKGKRSLFSIESMIKLNVDQFYGIELEEFSAKIAEVSLWLVDHQMNSLAALEFGQHFARIPLKASANIVHANALRIDWKEVLNPADCSYIIGNPPFYGSKMLTDEQRADVAEVFGKLKGAKVLDYVACWYRKSAEYIQNTDIIVGLVSTNSICQGEQAGILWKYLIEELSISIHFAHQTFKWDNQASGKAQVFVVIVGFAYHKPKEAKIYEYETVESEPHEKIVKSINGYLISGEPIFIERSGKPICEVPEIRFGNQPIDGGHLILTPEERKEIIFDCPDAEDLIRPFLGSKEFINGLERYCLWLENANPKIIKQSTLILERIESIRNFRLSRERAATRELANTPSQFAFVSHNESYYIIIPSVSSERREYIPLGFINPRNIASNLCLIIPNATTYHFGILTSQMHMAWMRYVCGRLKGDYRYSNSIVYNNFPWPEVAEPQKEKISELAQAVLNAREEFPDSSLADLYDPLTMPPKLLKTHQKLDKAVDQLYQKEAFASDAERVEMLFERYEKLISKYTNENS